MPVEDTNKLLKEKKIHYTFDQLIELIKVMKKDYESKNEKEVSELRKEIDKKNAEISDLENCRPEMEIQDTGLGSISYRQPESLWHQQIMESLEKLIQAKGAKYVMDQLEASCKQLEL